MAATQRSGIHRRHLLLAAVAAVATFAGMTNVSHAYISPASLLGAYGFDTTQQTYTGAGQTIVIYSSTYYSTLQSDVDYFSNKYMNGDSTTISVVNTSGTDLTGQNKSVSSELALDVEYAHLTAPDAKIVVVYSSTLSGAASYATKIGASVVSISYGSWDINSTSANMSAADKIYKSASDAGITVLGAAGDSSNLDYPASSPYVVGVGGTNLYVNTSTHKRTSEVGWSDGGGGQSHYELEPVWQQGVQSSGYRQGPDVSIAGGNASSMPVFVNATDSSDYSYYYGSSIATPIWAGLIALVDQARESNGLDTIGTTDLLTILYSLAGTSNYANAFYDVTSGTNANGVSAGVGWDELTGLGTPNVPWLVSYLSGVNVVDGVVVTVPEPASLGLLGLGAMLLMRRRHA